MGKKQYRIGIIPGDGIGRDVIKAARIVLDAINETSETFAPDFKPMETGEAAVKKYGHPFPKETLDGIAATDAVLFGAAGNPHTENANGDILSDVGAGVIGGMGFAYAGNIGDTMGVFEPIHGTAPKYADKNVVNPIAAIMAGKMLFDFLGEKKTAAGIEKAVIDVLKKGKVRTYDLGGKSSTTDVGEAIAAKLRQIS